MRGGRGGEGKEIKCHSGLYRTPSPRCCLTRGSRAVPLGATGRHLTSAYGRRESRPFWPCEDNRSVEWGHSTPAAAHGVFVVQCAVTVPFGWRGPWDLAHHHSCLWVDFTAQPMASAPVAGGIVMPCCEIIHRVDRASDEHEVTLTTSTCKYTRKLYTYMYDVCYTLCRQLYTQWTVPGMHT